MAFFSCLPCFFFSRASCNFFAGLFNPLIGTWEYSESGGTITFTFNYDNTWSYSVTSSGSTVSASGTYTQDSSAGTITFSQSGYTDSTMSYTINGNKLTLSEFSGIEFTKK